MFSYLCKWALTFCFFLQELNLAENRLYMTNDNRTDWSNLISLEVLDLSNNNLTFNVNLPNEWTITMTNLKELKLSKNNIGE